jgi:hypothetical protein
MSLKDSEMQVFSIVGAGALSALLIVPVVWFSRPAEAQRSSLYDNRQILEATIAYKKSPTKQPQKQFDQPDVVKPVGVSHDEDKKVEEKKEEKKKDEPKVDTKDPFKGIRRPDEAEGKPTTNPGGDFNGSEKGFAPTSTGDPFFGRLRADMNFQFPEIAKAQSIPIGCIHLQADGRIKAFTFDPPIGKKGDDDLQTAAEAALTELKKARNQNPEAVPSHLLEITKQWLCFKFSVSSG